MAHHLQDLPPLEGQASLLAGDGTVLPRVIVEEGTHEHLGGKGCSEGTLLYKGVGYTMTAAIHREKTRGPGSRRLVRDTLHFSPSFLLSLGISESGNPWVMGQ